MAPAPAPLLELQDLHVRVEDAEILRGVSLTVGEGELHALMGPNGSGKSTLAKTLLADPGYVITAGRIRFRGEDVTGLGPAERAARGMFLGFQHPEAISAGPSDGKGRIEGTWCTVDCGLSPCKFISRVLKPFRRLGDGFACLRQ